MVTFTDDEFQVLLDFFRASRGEMEGVDMADVLRMEDQAYEVVKMADVRAHNIRTDDEAYEHLMSLLQRPPEYKPKLHDLLAEEPPWED